LNSQVPADAPLEPWHDFPNNLPDLKTEFKRLFRGHPQLRKYVRNEIERRLWPMAGKSGDEWRSNIIITTLQIYKSFYFNRIYLNQYLDFIEYVQSYTPFDIARDAAQGNRREPPLATVAARIERREDGLRVKIVPDGISAALDGLYMDRLRRCAICKRIFWAKRKETAACSAKCQNAWRVHQSRNRPPEERAELAERKRGYYAHHKRRERNGTL
jgi:hypothetical protein